jgi:mannose-1-phosphate guanylyltransferase/mannose-6-phosphate isomerase
VPHDILPVLLSGGAGTRLWPLSRADRPKQLLPLVGERTMIQDTALRLADGEGLRIGAPLIVAGEAHGPLIAEQLADIGTTPAAIILEPMARNTAPAIGLAAEWLAARGEGERLMLVMPCDHLIAHPQAFRAAVAAAVPAALEGRLVTFGVEPTEPATGYGYIEADAGDGPVRPVARFVEKPDAETAARYVAQGYLWNAGIFLFRADAFRAAAALHAPEVAAAAVAAMAGAAADEGFVRPATDAFVTAPSISVDYAVMERSPAVSVVPVDMGWSDVGSWDALARVSPRDAQGNAARGDGALVDCRGTLLRNEGGPYVAALGLEDMVIVSTPDAVLVAPRARAEEIRRLVDGIEKAGLPLARRSAQRPA